MTTTTEDKVRWYTFGTTPEREIQVPKSGKIADLFAANMAAQTTAKAAREALEKALGASLLTNAKLASVMPHDPAAIFNYRFGPSVAFVTASAVKARKGGKGKADKLSIKL